MMSKPFLQMMKTLPNQCAVTTIKAGRAISSGLFALALVPAVALGQTPQDVNVSTSAGQEAQLGIYGTVEEPCNGLPAPQLKILRPPTNGLLIFRTVPVAMPATAGACAGRSVPVQVVFYEPTDGFTGQDEVLIEAGVPGQAGRLQRILIGVTP